MVSYWTFAPSNGLVFGLLVVEPVAEQKAKIPVRNFQVLEIRPVLGSGSIPVVGVGKSPRNGGNQRFQVG